MLNQIGKTDEAAVNSTSQSSLTSTDASDWEHEQSGGDKSKILVLQQRQ